jgi:hypothetical protein
VIAEKAYLLRFIGCMVLPNKTGDTIPMAYLAMLDDLERASRYAWGAMLLAHLYQQLSNASIHTCRQISGCLGLLQV